MGSQRLRKNSSYVTIQLITDNKVSEILVITLLMTVCHHNLEKPSSVHNAFGPCYYFLHTIDKGRLINTEPKQKQKNRPHVFFQNKSLADFTVSKAFISLGINQFSFHDFIGNIGCLYIYL